jgi:hypothetical protein
MKKLLLLGIMMVVLVPSCFAILGMMRIESPVNNHQLPIYSPDVMIDAGELPTTQWGVWAQHYLIAPRPVNWTDVLQYSHYQNYNAHHNNSLWIPRQLSYTNGGFFNYSPNHGIFVWYEMTYTSTPIECSVGCVMFGDVCQTDGNGRPILDKQMVNYYIGPTSRCIGFENVDPDAPVIYYDLGDVGDYT